MMESELAFHMIFEHSLFFFLGVFSVKFFESLFRITMDYSHQQPQFNHRNKINSDKIKCNSFTNIWKNAVRFVFKFKTIGYVWMLASVTILVFWHIPSVFDSAVLNDDIHELQHVSFVAVGAMMFLSTQFLGDSYKIFLLVILASMMGSMGLIFSLTNVSIYNTYSVSSHNYAGIYMIVTGLLILIVVMPFFMIRNAVRYLKSKM